MENLKVIINLVCIVSNIVVSAPDQVQANSGLSLHQITRRRYKCKNCSPGYSLLNRFTLFFQNRGARIIIGNFFGKGARRVFCEVGFNYTIPLKRIPFRMARLFYTFCRLARQIRHRVVPVQAMTGFTVKCCYGQDTLRSNSLILPSLKKHSHGIVNILDHRQNYL